MAGSWSWPTVLAQHIRVWEAFPHEYSGGDEYTHGCEYPVSLLPVVLLFCGKRFAIEPVPFEFRYTMPLSDAHPIPRLILDSLCMKWCENGTNLAQMRWFD